MSREDKWYERGRRHDYSQNMRKRAMNEEERHGYLQKMGHRFQEIRITLNKVQPIRYPTYEMTVIDAEPLDSQENL